MCYKQFLGIWCHSFHSLVVNCDALTDPTNGQVSHLNGTTFGQTATYSCDTTYTLMGNITRTCQANGVWSGNPPTCICESNLLKQTPKLILAKFLIPPSYLKQVLLFYSLAIPFGKFSGHTVWQYLNRAIPFGVAVSGKGGLLLKWYFVSSFLINNFALWFDGHHFFLPCFDTSVFIQQLYHVNFRMS